jgi:hypothetical protein
LGGVVGGIHIRSLRDATGQPGADHDREVRPFQWKIGLSILCGFLIFQAFNPIVLGRETISH